MHICHFITTLERGGAQSLVRDIIDTDDSGQRHSVCHFSNDFAIEDEVRKAGGDVVKIGEPSYSSIPRICQNLIRYLVKEDVDVLHTHLMHATIIGRIAGRLAGVSGIVTTIHNVRRNFTSFEQYAERVTRPLDSETVAVSKAVCKSFDADGEWRTIPNGIPTEKFYNRVRTADTSVVPNEACRNGPTFLNVARYVPEKNQTLLVRAMESVLKQRPEASLLVVGRGPEESKLKSLVDKLEVGDRVFIVGEVPDIHPYFAVADWFLLPSDHEGLPITVLEAMAAGLPVIASDIPGVRDIIVNDETGLLIEQVSSKNLAAILRGVTEPKQELMAKKARRHVQTKYDIEVAVQNYNQTYKRMIE